MELDGKTMGIIGFGRIGQATGRIACALGMEVLATGSHPTEEGRSIARYTDLDTLLSSSDVIALHCPLFPETAGMINRDTIARMKDGVILLNTARGGLIVEQDLADALNSGKVAAVGVDSVSSEPIRSDNPLLQAKNCIITPHIAWGSPGEQAADHGLHRRKPACIPLRQPYQYRQLSRHGACFTRRRAFVLYCVLFEKLL